MDVPIIWIRQPRTGGTSLKWFLLTGNVEVPSEVLKNPDSFNKIKEGKLLSIKPSYKKIVMIETNKNENAVFDFRNKYPDFFDEAIKFVIVRNPWDKYVSGWKYCHTTKNKSFEEVVKHPPTKEESHHDWNHLTRPQLYSITDKNWELMVTVIIRFESLREDLKKIFTNIGIKFDDLPHIRATTHEAYRKYYTEELRDIVEKRYSKDIQTFDYQF